MKDVMNHLSREWAAGWLFWVAKGFGYGYNNNNLSDTSHE